MLTIRQHRIYREDCKANPHILYIFGDNLDRQGYGGQAAEMRDEPNAFGIATKRGIGHGYPQDYFFDGEDDVIDILKAEFHRLHLILKEDILHTQEMPPYKAIIIPLDGIGTGLSRMPELAPYALKFIEEQFKLLEKL